MTDNITYKTILNRCKSDVLEYIPDMPTDGSLNSWESYLDELEAWRDDSLYENASESVDSWDWSIYTHFGFTILQTLPSDVERDAEQSFMDVWGSEPIDTLNDPYDMASRIAYFALVNIWQEVAQEYVEELIELASNQIENEES